MRLSRWDVSLPMAVSQRSIASSWYAAAAATCAGSAAESMITWLAYVPLALRRRSRITYDISAVWMSAIGVMKSR